MDQETLQECLVAHIRDIYDAEKQLTKALPKMAKAASSEELETAFRDHLAETQGQVERLDKVFEALGVAAKGKPCKGMKGLIEEGGEAIEEEEGPIRDLALIAAAQKVEHYEISAYGTARTLAEQIGNDEAVQLLQETEEEEKAADSKLTEIAMSIYEMEDEGASSDEDDNEASVEAGEDEEAAAPRRQPVGASTGRAAQRSRTAAR